MGDWTWVGAQALSPKSGMLGWLLKTWSSKNFPTSLQPSRVSVFSPLLYWDQVPLGSADWSWTFSNPLNSASWVLALWWELACATLCGPSLIITSWLQMCQHSTWGVASVTGKQVLCEVIEQGQPSYVIRYKSLTGKLMGPKSMDNCRQETKDIPICLFFCYSDFGREIILIVRLMEEAGSLGVEKNLK